MKIDWVDSTPKKTIPIYQRLRNDKVLYVRRSVANSMGDLIRIDEDLAMATFETWLSMKHTVENLWVIRHAIRRPVKKELSAFLKLNRILDRCIKNL
ncbi:MAG: hypothetical protein HRU19_00990 [Pseudobacteriovorax sp.]|nr:hypothetical protein [Pseudobacteriovorax sp.]